MAGVLTARAKGWLAFVIGMGAFVSVLAAWPTILAGHVLDVRISHWDGPAQFAFHVDGLSLLFALMGTGIGAAVLFYAVAYMEEEKGTTRFYSLVLIFITGLINLVYTADLFLFYLSWELVGLCSFLLVGFWYTNPDSAYGARKVFTMTHLAGYGLLAAVVLIYVRTGSTLWTDPRVQGAFTTGIFVLVLISAMAKSVQFPLHTWIPYAMFAPTPVSALLHAAVYVKAGVYLMSRLHSFGTWPASWGLALSWVGAITLLVGVLFALAQHDLKRLLAYHTVSQIGYMMLGIGLGTPLGIAAGLLHCLNHGLFKGGLFMCAGAVQHATGTRDMDQLGGLGRKMPRTTALWLVVAGGIAGIPLLNGFVSKWLLYNAALDAHQPILALIPWVGSILTVFSFLKATSCVFFDNEGPAVAQAHEVPWTMSAGIGVLAGGCILLGIAPQLAIKYIINPLLPALGSASLTGVSWLGFAAGQGDWYATGGLILSILALGFSALIFWLPRPARGMKAAGGRPTIFTGGEPLTPQGRMGASDFAEVVASGLAPVYRGLDVDRMWLGLWHAAGRLASALARLLSGLEGHAVNYLVGAGSLAAVLAWILLPRAAAVQPVADPPLTPLAVALFVSLAGLLLACWATKALRRWTLPLAVAGVMACAGVLTTSSIQRSLLLEAASAVALLILWRTGKRPAWHAYFAAVIISAVGMVGGSIAAEHGNVELARVLLLPGIAVKLGLFPLWFWLPLVAESAPAVVAGLVIAIIDVAAFAEVVTLRTVAPEVFSPALPWLAVGAISAAGGALFALAQGNLKRLLAFSTISDMGLMMVALIAGGAWGIEGAILGAAAHAIAKALLFASVSGPEAEDATMVNPRGLASQHPLSSFGFVVGALAVLGVPPTLGYAGHWRIFSAVANNIPLFVILAGSAMLNVATYGRAIALFWWGSVIPAPPRRGYSRVALGAAIVLLVLAALITGVWPRALGVLGGIL
ncbi:proton-conducting transporter membrane subunit [Edaphobacter aggregans]|uniref:proton-conducting transporter transmembrane domain-containing protein n=1 Tax=Edaphobacter aggregans TaxID=570835 RepID=UPI001B806DBA|nr:proton-conducting transporter membrane subunit [Edaphobacter aggregans]